MMNDPKRGRGQGHVTYFWSNGTDTRVPQNVFLVIIIIIIIIWTMFMVLSSWYNLLREFARFIWRMQASASSRRPPTLRPGQPTRAASPPVGCYIAYNTYIIAILLLLSPKADTRFIVPRRVESWVDLSTQHATLYNIRLHCTWVWETCPRFFYTEATWPGVEPRIKSNQIKSNQQLI